jgi:hypothetical protein
MTSRNFRVVPRAARPPSLLLLASFVALLSGCGDKVTPPPPPPPPPPQPVTEVVREGGGSLGILTLGSLAFDTTKRGTIDVTVDWTFATNDVDVYLAKGSCSFDQFISRQCDMVAFSESTIAKPEKISAPNAAPGAYTLLVGNLGPTDESVSFQILLTSVPGASSAVAKAAAAGGHPSLAKGQMTRAVRLR